MLLVLDVGNTNTVLGVFARVAHVTPAEDTAEDSGRYERLVAQWRVATIHTQTVDEYGVLFRNLFAMDNLQVSGIRGIVISSVVPPVDSTLRQVCERYFHTRPLFIEPGVKTGMPVQYDNPAEVGADRVVNSVAAFEKYGGPCISVDFGTATTFDCVSAKGEYIGGVISPGIGISAEALFGKTARLQRVDIRKPSKVIGTNTVASMQSGLYYGYLGLVDGILDLLLKEMGGSTKIVATGGLASLFGEGSKYIKTVDDTLTLEGLRIIWQRNNAGVRNQEPTPRGQQGLSAAGPDHAAAKPKASSANQLENSSKATGSAKTSSANASRNSASASTTSGKPRSR